MTNKKTTNKDKQKTSKHNKRNTQTKKHTTTNNATQRQKQRHTHEVKQI